MLVTITGPNSFMSQQLMQNFVSEFTREHGDIAIDRINEEIDSVELVRTSLQSLSLFTPRRLVIWYLPSHQKVFTESIEVILKDLPDTTDLIIYEPKLDKRSTYYKQLKQLTDFRESSELSGQNLYGWMRQYAQEQAAKLESKAAEALVQRVGSDQLFLKSELDKLLAYTSDVTVATVDLLVEPLPRSSVFDLLEAAFAGDKNRVFNLYDEQRQLKVDPQAIIGMIAWQLHILLMVKAAGGQLSDNSMKRAKLSSFVLRRAQSLSRSRTLRDIENLINDLALLDLGAKKGAIDVDEAMRLYLLQLS